MTDASRRRDTAPGSSRDEVSYNSPARHAVVDAARCTLAAVHRAAKRIQDRQRRSSYMPAPFTRIAWWGRLQEPAGGCKARSEQVTAPPPSTSRIHDRARINRGG